MAALPARRRGRGGFPAASRSAGRCEGRSQWFGPGAGRVEDSAAIACRKAGLLPGSAETVLWGGIDFGRPICQFSFSKKKSTKPTCTHDVANILQTKEHSKLAYEEESMLSVRNATRKEVRRRTPRPRSPPPAPQAHSMRPRGTCPSRRLAPNTSVLHSPPVTRRPRDGTRPASSIPRTPAALALPLPHDYFLQNSDLLTAGFPPSFLSSYT